MSRLRFRLAVTACALATAIIVSACGSSTAPASPTAPAGATPATSPLASPAPASPAPGSPTTGAPTSDPDGDIDLGDLAEALESVDSYRLTMSAGGRSSVAVVIRRPAPAQSWTSGGSTVVTIGNEAWVDGQPVPVEMAAALTSAFDPILLIGAWAEMGSISGVTDLGIETKNGQRARHVRIDSNNPVLGASLPAGAAIDIWVAEAGYLVSYATSGFGAGGDMAIDVSNVNDPANRVDRP